MGTDVDGPRQRAGRNLGSDLAGLRRSLRPGALRDRLRTATTAGRIMVIAVATFLPVVLLSLALTGSLTRNADLTAQVREHVQGRITAVLSLNDELGDASVLLDRLFASGAAHDREAFAAHSRRVDAAFAPLLAAGTGGAEQPLAAAWDSWTFVRDTVVAPDFAVPVDPQARTGLLATLSTALAQMRGDLRDLSDATTNDIVRLAVQAQGTADDMRVLLVGGLVVSGLLGAALVTWLVRDLRRGIGELEEAAERIRAGRFDHRVQSQVHRDLAPVAAAFNAMAERVERQRTELHGLANHDGLTGTLNRRTFETELSTELERAERYGHPTALLLLDIDHFKAVNDTLGHQAGDAVLKAVAEQVAAAVRGVDRVGRWGGEEFAILLPETDELAARRVAERVVRLVRDRTVLVGGRKVQVTVSVGVSVHRAGQTTEQVVALADAALYAAKDGGRDQARVAGS